VTIVRTQGQIRIGVLTACVALVALLAGAAPVVAHPADEILEQDTVTVRPDGITINLTISAGAIKLLKIWSDVDTNNDKRLDAAEIEAYGRFLATGYAVDVDGQSLPAAYELGTLVMKTAYEDFELQGADPTGAMVNATFTVAFPAAPDRHEIIVSVNHYNAYSNDRPPDLYPEGADGITVTEQGGDDGNLRLTAVSTGAATATTPMRAPQRPTTARTGALQRFARDPTGGPFYVSLAIVVAIALGALHALTPGHGKTLMAAYLVGSRGTVGQACALGGVITLAHTGSVIALGVATVALAGTVVPERAILWIEFVSGGAIVLLGLALLRARLHSARVRTVAVRRRAARQPALTLATATAGSMVGDSGARWHEHTDGTVHAHGWFGAHAHTHAPPRDRSWRSLVLMGASGGIIPCPDALAILLVAMAAGHVLLGVAIVLGFSVGLATVLIAIGILLTATRLPDRATARWGWAGRVAPWLPAVSAAIVIVLGIGALMRAAPALLR
jgi:nickel/cobalt exporter